MKLLDSSVWLALAIPAHAHHTDASRWISEQHGEGGIFFCRATQQSLLRLLTTRAVLHAYGSPALTNDQAWTLYNGFASDSRVAYLEEPVGLQVSWQRLSSRPSSSPKLWMDAYLAALSISSGTQLVTIDRDFKQFLGLDLLILSDDTAN